jgi:TIR domain
VSRDSTTQGNPRTVDPSQAFVLISYRRRDTAAETARLHDRLAAEYGAERVFLDIHDIPLGIDFVDHVRTVIDRCSAVIVMIGTQWLTITDESGQRRLDDPDDPVRMEVAAALQQKHIGVIPVIVQNASLPSPKDLPADIRLLARRNCIQLQPEQWDEGVERLLRALKPTMIGK